METEARLAAEKEAARQAEARATEILRKRDRDSPRSNHSNHSRTSPSPHHPAPHTTLRKQPTEEVIIMIIMNGLYIRQSWIENIYKKGIYVLGYN